MNLCNFSYSPCCCCCCWMSSMSFSKVCFIYNLLSLSFRSDSSQRPVVPACAPVPCWCASSTTYWTCPSALTPLRDQWFQLVPLYLVGVLHLQPTKPALQVRLLSKTSGSSLCPTPCWCASSTTYWACPSGLILLKDQWYQLVVPTIVLIQLVGPTVGQLYLQPVDLVLQVLKSWFVPIFIYRL